MGCFPFANSHFQMGATVMGFAEHFGHRLILDLLASTLQFCLPKLMRSLLNITLESILLKTSMVIKLPARPNVPITRIATPSTQNCAMNFKSFDKGSWQV